MRKRIFDALGYVSLIATGLALQSCAPANSSELAQTGGQSAGRSAVMPVRISREFFENRVTAGVQVKDASGKTLLSDQNPTYFEELQPTGPEPTPGYQADFRDRPGCSRLQGSLAGVSVCFTVAPDVSSVDVSAEKVSIEGSDRLLAASNAGCAEGTALLFQGAQRTASGVTMLYTASCAQPVNLQIQLQAI